MVQCTYCNKEYKNKYTLKAHQNRPSCLKNQNLSMPVTYDCVHCGTTVSSRGVLNRHMKTCKAKILNDKDAIITEQQKIIDDMKAEIEELRNRPTTTIINNDNRTVNINNYVKESQKTVSTDVLKEYIPKLTMNHILGGGTGLAQYVIDHICSDVRIVTKDHIDAL